MLIYNQISDFSSPLSTENSAGLDIHYLKLRSRFPMIFVYLRRGYHVKFRLRKRVYAAVERDEFHLRIFSVAKYSARMFGAERVYLVALKIFQKEGRPCVAVSEWAE